MERISIIVLIEEARHLSLCSTSCCRMGFRLRRLLIYPGFVAGRAESRVIVGNQCSVVEPRPGVARVRIGDHLAGISELGQTTVD